VLGTASSGTDWKSQRLFLELVEKVTAVPTFRQKGLLDLAPVILGVAVAYLPWLRQISMVQGEEADPHVLVAAQVLAGLDAEQTSFFILLVSSPTIILDSRTGKVKRQPTTAR
jgi:hypothetical protein